MLSRVAREAAGDASSAWWSDLNVDGDFVRRDALLVATAGGLLMRRTRAQNSESRNQNSTAQERAPRAAEPDGAVPGVGREVVAVRRPHSDRAAAPGPAPQDANGSGIGPFRVPFRASCSKRRGTSRRPTPHVAHHVMGAVRARPAGYEPTSTVSRLLSDEFARLRSHCSPQGYVRPSVPAPPFSIPPPSATASRPPAVGVGVEPRHPDDGAAAGH
jgi:hypothetical protein